MAAAHLYSTLTELAQGLRAGVSNKPLTLLYAYNGTGKTRLSMAFKDEGKKSGGRDTLYFNAFTEDLFSWENDLEGDIDRVLLLNQQSTYFQSLHTLEMESRIAVFLRRHADFDFRIDYERFAVTFSRSVATADGRQTIDNVKISRGEERLFVWAFFLAILQIAKDDEREGTYSWVQYVYIDDPVASLDDNHVVSLATELADLIDKSSTGLKVVVSTHHALFFNVLQNALCRGKERSGNSYFLSLLDSHCYKLTDMSDKPFLYHVAQLYELKRAIEADALYAYHFNVLRTILERTAAFHGYKRFSDCLGDGLKQRDAELYARLLNLLSHNVYPVYEPTRMLEENKVHFQTALGAFLDKHRFDLTEFAGTQGDQGI